jgi:hypothetical protein
MNKPYSFREYLDMAKIPNFFTSDHVSTFQDPVVFAIAREFGYYPVCMGGTTFKTRISFDDNFNGRHK